VTIFRKANKGNAPNELHASNSPYTFSLLEYKSSSNAQASFYYLKNVKMFGVSIDINFSKYDTLMVANNGKGIFKVDPDGNSKGAEKMLMDCDKQV
jgi:hypothetical protein